ncbi:three-Cys-motif partner protein TcmP [bacterium]|nr:three-Cys-motif partner protein TcmP [bacterium]
MGNTDDFFAKKHEWSEIKDSILGAYLTPYLAKISRTGKAVRVADCFAGKGRFEDGKPGSPIIIQSAINKQLQTTPDASIKGVFIEKKYVEDLRRTLTESEFIHILEGDYEVRMDYLISSYDARNRNLFLYIDPYGVKSLKMAHFRDITEMPFHTVEVLVNLNAHGFLREGCRLLKGSILEGESLQENYEQDVNSPENLDSIAGGEYWRSIVEDYYKSRDLLAAEDAFVAEYMTQLGTAFSYVLQFPIKKKLSHIAKYRMVYCTNHTDGLLLMADNMALRWKEFREGARPQDLLFEMDFPERSATIGTVDLQNEIIKQTTSSMLLKDLLVQIVGVFGVSFSFSEIKDLLKTLEKKEQIKVVRIPDTGPSGRKFRGWDHTERSGCKLYIERGVKWQQALQ